VIGDRIGKVIGKPAEAIDSLKGAINVVTSSPNSTAVARQSSFGSGRMKGRRARPASASLPGNLRALRPAEAKRGHNSGDVCDPSDHRSALRLALAQAIRLTAPMRPQRAPSVPTQHGAPASPAAQEAGAEAGSESGCPSEHPMKSKG
jgi:hypothetical protein